MKNYTYSVNSQGEVLKNERISVLDNSSRQADLESFIEHLQRELTDLKAECVCYMFDTEGVKEQVTFFTKEMLPATSEIVKQAYASKEEKAFHYSSDIQKALYESVTYTEDKNRTVWWTLKAQTIQFERNISDNEYIQAQKLPVEYHYDFCKRIKNTHDFAIFCVEGFNPLDERQVVQTAVVEDESIDFMINNALPSLHTDPLSNKAMETLWDITDNKYTGKIFDTYEHLKKFLRKNFPDVNCPYYHSNAISFKLGDKQYAMYLCGGDELHFIMNGKRYEDIQTLKDALLSGEALKEQKWFEDKVKPYTPKKPEKQRQSRKKDTGLIL